MKGTTMETVGPLLWLLSSVIAGIFILVGVCIGLFYSLCVKSNRVNVKLNSDLSSIITELLAAKTYGETGNEKIATHLLKHSTIHEDTPSQMAQVPQVPQVRTGPVIGDEVLVGDEPPPDITDTELPDIDITQWGKDEAEAMEREAEAINIAGSTGVIV